jgi:hypothetical protein
MNRTLCAIVLCLFAIAADRLPPELPGGRYRVDLLQLRSEAMKDKHEMIVNGVSLPVSNKDWAKWVDGFCQMVGSAELELKSNKTFVLNTPLFEVSGRWAGDAGTIRGVVDSSRLKISGPVTLKTASDFVLYRDGSTIRYANSNIDRAVPMKRLSNDTAR